MNKIRNILNKINPKPKDKYNILTFATHEGYQTALAETGHNFYLLNRPNEKKWNKAYRPIPKGHVEIDVSYDDIDIDFVLSHERFGQLQFAHSLSKRARLPIVHIEHIEPQDKWSKESFESIKKLRGDINLFITDHNRQSWGNPDGIIMPHGIDTNLFNGWNPDREKPYILYVVNYLKGRDYFCGYTQWLQIKTAIQEKYPEIEFRLVGDNEDLGYRPAKSPEELVQQYQGCIAYLNTSQLSPIPMSLLEAMSVGCPIITTAKQEIPRIMNGSNGVCFNDISKLIDNLLLIIEDKIDSKSFGKSARQTILEKFSLDQFIKNWNNIFDQAYNIGLGKHYE